MLLLMFNQDREAHAMDPAVLPGPELGLVGKCRPIWAAYVHPGFPIESTQTPELWPVLL